ncbi:MAG: L,D-transpeptidase family protein [Candidatus Falkowbacteria bacterium]|nr:L,D-transpeptidase family protein [Candidatus Falkowbacteria bacterium]
MAKIIFIIFISFFLALSVRATLDTDKDGLSDDLEVKFKTDINNPDTDGDGYKDGSEVDWGYNPLAKDKIKLPLRIAINLKTQKLFYLVNDIELKQFSISSGKPGLATPQGNFKIVNKATKAWSKKYGLWMPFWLGLNHGEFGIHELPIWPNGYREGSDHLGRPVSHGCVRLGIGPAEYLFERLATGTEVLIY